MRVASWTGSFLDWEQELAAFKARLAPVFTRLEHRQTSGLFLDGLLWGIERKTGWLMAEQAGLERPYRMQSLLGRSQWSEDGLRDAVRSYVIETLGDADGVLIVDETGFVKKGTSSAGVARQYSGTAGRIENSQIGVFLAYASRFWPSAYRPAALFARRLGERRRKASQSASAGRDRLRHQARPSPRSPGNKSLTRSMPASLALLCWPMLCTDRIRACAACWGNVDNPMFWL